MAKIQITGGGFQDSEGNVLANGYLEMTLSQDCQVAATAQICSGITVRVPLDAFGNVSGTVLVWPNDQLLPSNNFYTVKAFTFQGQTAWGPNVQQVLGAGPFSLNSWIPNQLILWNPQIVIPQLQTNEVPNVMQGVLDLHAGSNITLTDNGLGRVTIASSGGGGGATINVVAAADLTAGMLVNVFNSAGTVKCQPADSNNKLPADGFVSASFLTGATATVNLSGIVTFTDSGDFFSVSDIGNTAYLDLAGAANDFGTETAGKMFQPVGCVLSYTGTAPTAVVTMLFVPGNIYSEIFRLSDFAPKQFIANSVTTNLNTNPIQFNNSTIGVDATSANKTVQLPAIGSAPNQNKSVFRIAKIDNSANTVTIIPTGADTINGNANYVLTARYKFVVLAAIGDSVTFGGFSQWVIFGSN